MGDESRQRTLYVGNLDPQITEAFVLHLFQQIGPCESCKIIHEPGNDPYCFVEFTEHSSAAAALLAMNKRSCMGKEMKVNWATSPSSAPKQDTSKHFHVFVGDLSPDVEQHQLVEAFRVFGEMSDCKIIRDANTLKPKGYGFVSFVRKTDAENAIAGMNGSWIGSRPIRTNWATRKPSAPNQKEGSGYHREYAVPKQLNYDEVYSKSSPTNCTVYCGQNLPELTEETIRAHFAPFGKIHEVRIFKDKGYAFIRFSNKDDAARAIVDKNGTEINDALCRCSWGKESNEGGPGPQGQQSQSQVPPGGQGYGGQYGGGQYNNYYGGYPNQQQWGGQGYMQGYPPPGAYYQGYGGGMGQGGYMPVPPGGQGNGQGQGQYNGQQSMNYSMQGYQSAQ